MRKRIRCYKLRQSTSDLFDLRTNAYLLIFESFFSLSDCRCTRVYDLSFSSSFSTMNVCFIFSSGKLLKWKHKIVRDFCDLRHISVHKLIARITMHSIAWHFEWLITKRILRYNRSRRSCLVHEMNRNLLIHSTLQSLLVLFLVAAATVVVLLLPFSKYSLMIGN